jgi:hypothetical protein
MPIIDRAVLKIHLANLASNYVDPKAFLRDFHNLVGEYYNHTKRETQKKFPIDKRSDIITSTIINQVANELFPLVISDPSMGSILINSLWDDGSLEARILSSLLLGIMDPNYALDILIHLPEWLASTSNKLIHESFTNYSFIRIRQEKQTQFLHLLEGWFTSSKVFLQILGIRALIPLLQEKSFEDLPTIFRIVKPTFMSVCLQSQKDVQRCISYFEKVSFDETLLFLRELIYENQSSFNEHLQRMLPGFSKEFQDKVRNIINNNKD